MKSMSRKVEKLRAESQKLSNDMGRKEYLSAAQLHVLRKAKRKVNLKIKKLLRK